jgi:hypothetical protein
MKRNKEEGTGNKMIEARENHSVDSGNLVPSSLFLVPLFHLPARRVDAGNDMDYPAERPKGEQPHGSGEHKLKDGRQHAALHQLAQAWNPDAANRRNDVAGGTLACGHDAMLAMAGRIVQSLAQLNLK